MASWEIAAVSLDNFVPIFCCPVLCDPGYFAFLGFHVLQHNTAELVWPEPLDDSFLAVNVCKSFLIPNTRPVLRLVMLTQKNLRWPADVTSFLLHLKCKFHFSVHHVFSHACNAGNECADIAASFGMIGFVSECNVPLFWL